ncbi:PilZ domain-containing protein [Chungangia koreensis]|uniref:PilZ domain-containing protein n=1 Tax=Chungangia koreensis TaxID=752657 RepID=A0ABV8X0T1_9LACT
MFYKRKEIFRYTFGSPLEAELKMGDENGSCRMIDISPGGAKVFSDNQLTKGMEVVMQFVLMQDTITAPGKVVWKQASHEGALYGIDFNEDEKLEEQIISQLKFRRRNEISTK